MQEFSQLQFICSSVIAWLSLAVNRFLEIICIWYFITECANDYAIIRKNIVAVVWYSSHPVFCIHTHGHMWPYQVKDRHVSVQYQECVVITYSDLSSCHLISVIKQRENQRPLMKLYLYYVIDGNVLYSCFSYLILIFLPYLPLCYLFTQIEYTNF